MHIVFMCIPQCIILYYSRAAIACKAGSQSFNHSNNNNNNNEYISRELNPSVSNQPEDQGAVHVQLKLSKLHIQLKPSKQRNQRRRKTRNKSRGWAGKGARSKYSVNN